MPPTVPATRCSKVVGGRRLRAGGGLTAAFAFRRLVPAGGSCQCRALFWQKSEDNSNNSSSKNVNNNHNRDSNNIHGTCVETGRGGTVRHSSEKAHARTLGHDRGSIATFSQMHSPPPSSNQPTPCLTLARRHNLVLGRRNAIVCPWCLKICAI